MLTYDGRRHWPLWLKLVRDQFLRNSFLKHLLCHNNLCKDMMFGVIHVFLYSFLTTPRHYNTAPSAVRGFEPDKLCPWETRSNLRTVRLYIPASPQIHPVWSMTTRVYLSPQIHPVCSMTAKVYSGRHLGMPNTALQLRAPTIENRVGYICSVRPIPAQALRLFWHMRGRNLHWLLMAKIFCNFCSCLEECQRRCRSLWLTCSECLSVEEKTSSKTSSTSPWYDGLKLQRAKEVCEQLAIIWRYRQQRALAVFSAVSDMQPPSWHQLLLLAKLSEPQRPGAEEHHRTVDQIRRLFIVINIHGGH